MVFLSGVHVLTSSHCKLRPTTEGANEKTAPPHLNLTLTTAAAAAAHVPDHPVHKQEMLLARATRSSAARWSPDFFKPCCSG
jgi:hypothetical protein